MQTTSSWNYNLTPPQSNDLVLLLFPKFLLSHIFSLSPSLPPLSSCLWLLLSLSLSLSDHSVLLPSHSPSFAKAFPRIREKWRRRVLRSSICWAEKEGSYIGDSLSPSTQLRTRPFFLFAQTTEIVIFKHLHLFSIPNSPHNFFLLRSRQRLFFPPSPSSSRLFFFLSHLFPLFLPALSLSRSL